MPQEASATDRLDSWKEIAGYVGRDVRTVIRWEQKGGLPVYRVPVGQRQAVYAFRHEIDEWMGGNVPGSTELAKALEVAATRPEWGNTKAGAIGPAPVIESAPAHVRAPLHPAMRMAGWLFGIMLTVGAVFALLSLLGPHQVLLLQETQITGDEAIKRGLVTDGKNVFFGEMREGRILLSSVPVEGGPTRLIPTPFVQAEPMDVNSHGQLLVLAGEGEEHERSLWEVDADGSNLRRVGDFRCHAAAWSPDGRIIAYAYGDSVFLAIAAGGPSRLMHAFAATPLLIRWSFDGRRFLVRLRDSSTWNSELWEVVLGRSGNLNVESIVPAVLIPRDYNAFSIFDQYDDAFVGTGKDIWVLQRTRLPWQSGFRLKELTREVSGHDSFAVDERAHRLYVNREVPAHDELDRYDRDSRQFRPFLPGTSAHDVDFSRDGHRIVYVREPDNTLWISASDGSAARQIPTAGLQNIELPRWSPDEKQIAFMGKRSGSPYRILIWPVTGGPIREASHGTDNQGAPTWSPDGRYIVYGRVLCQEEGVCAIEQIDLRTGDQTMVPGSEGLSTARWSPNGRFIAALRSDRHEVYVLERQLGQWRKLADGANGNDLAWSPDSKTVYASKPNGDRPEVIRISIESGKAEPAVDLSDFSKLSGRIDTWFAVTPDDSILFLRIVGGHEIWAWNYVVR